MSRATAIVAVLTMPVCADASGVEPQRVSYRSPDGVEIVADYYAAKSAGRAGAPVVVMLHQYPSTRSSWQPLAEMFGKAGYVVLAPNLRGHGESIKPDSMGLEQGRKSRDTKHYRAAYLDVMGAYEWLRGRKDIDRSRFALVGASIGASVALDYASRDKSVDVVVCLSPGANYFGLDSKRDIVKCRTRPILLISPDSERSSSETLGKLVKKATVNVIEGSKLHGTFMLGKVPGIERTVVSFVDKHIGKPSKRPVMASIKSNKYHLPTCRYAKPSSGERFAVRAANLRTFSSATEAEARGYKPCKVCGK